MNSVLNAYAQSKDVVGVERALEKMAQMGLQPTIFAMDSVLNAYAQSKNVVVVERVLEQMAQMGLQPDANTMN